MRMMRWWMQQTNKTHGNNEKHGRRLERRSWGVTTLLHLQEISPHDLRMALERSKRGRGKTKLLLWQTSETTNLERLNERKERIQGRWMRLKTLCYQRGTRNIARTFVGWKTWMEKSMNENYFANHSGLNEIEKEWERKEFSQHSGRKEKEKLDKMERTWRDDITLRLNR